MGNGLTANFNLEGHVAADTGISDARLFRRQSNVGISWENFGTLTLGRQYNLAIFAFAATDPRGLRENFSGLYSWAFNSRMFNKNAVSRLLTTPLGRKVNHDVGVFLQNAILYSNTMGPVGIAGAYSFSESAGNATNTGNHGVVYSLASLMPGPFPCLPRINQPINPALPVD